MRHGSFQHAAHVGALAVAAVMLAGTLVGCGSMTTSPLTSMDSVETTGATMDGAGSSTMPGDDGPGIDGPPNTTPSVPTGPAPNALDVLAPFTPGQSAGMIVQGSDMTANSGGTLKNGRWTLTVPGGALAGNAHVTLGVPTLKSWGCELQISPADLNHFAVPVKLTVDCKSLTRKGLTKSVICWYNPATRGWEPVAGSTVDTKKKTVSAQLSHFSIYVVKSS